MKVDLRAGEVFSGPEDPKFIELSLYWHLTSRDLDAGEVSATAISLKHDLEAALAEPFEAIRDLCGFTTKIWTTTPEDLPFRVVYNISRIFGCQNVPQSAESGGNLQPQLDTKELIAAVKKFLADDFKKVAEITTAGKQGYEQNEQTENISIVII